MMTLIDLILGLGIFLFGMSQLERGIESLSGNWIKQWLSKSTAKPVGAVLSGTIITAILQSSSMVGLIILAFASAGIIPLYNAIGVLLGANLGTTFTGWIVTTLGFKLNLATVALPAIGLGCLVQVFADKSPKIRDSGLLLFGLGMLLFGLGLMKESVGDLPQQLDINQLRELNAVSFLLLGVVLTAVIQSSSASMMIALAALNSGIIDLSGAAALIIGADLGTTSTTALGSLKGSIIKRQLALAHFVFNLVVDLLAFLLLLPILPLVLAWLKIEDPLYSLVAFHSIFNAIGLFIFVPFLRPFSEWIGRRFVSDQDAPASLHDVPIDVPEAALNACQKHVEALLTFVISLNLRNLKLDYNHLSLTPEVRELLVHINQEPQSFEQRYEQLKQHEGDLFRYAMRLQQQPLNPPEADQLTRLLNGSRDAVYSAKAMKDIRLDLIELRHSLLPPLQQLSDEYQNSLKLFYQLLMELVMGQHEPNYIAEELEQLSQFNEQQHQRLHSEIQRYSGQGEIESEQLSTLLNINREVWYCGRSLIHSIKHLRAL
jgi:phosphate:Na+ symporter